MTFVGRIRRITSMPSLNLLVGIIFVVTGGSEIYEIYSTDLEGPRLGAHHGIFIAGIFQVFKTIPDFFEGMEYMDKE